MASGTFLDLFKALRWREFLRLGFDQRQGQRLLVFADMGAQQLVHPTTAALKRLAVENFYPDGTLLAVDFTARLAGVGRSR